MAQDGFRCLISGRVQGVWFRASTKDKAYELNVAGWVKNTSDGRVEVYAYGKAEDLEKLKQWLHQGPPLAQVTRVDYVECEVVSFDEFEVVE